MRAVGATVPQLCSFGRSAAPAPPGIRSRLKLDTKLAHEIQVGPEAGRDDQSSTM